MILLFLNLILALMGAAFFALSKGSTPLWLAIPCLVFGGIVILSRSLAWLTGAAQAGFAVANSQPIEYRARMKNGMVIMEFLLWSLGLFNVWIFVERLL